MKTMRQVEHLKKEGKDYQVLYMGRPVADITLESGKELDRSGAYEVVEYILHQQKPGMKIHPALVSYTEIK